MATPRLLIIIHVHEAVAELARLIDSIAANHRLDRYPILIINNAHDHSAAERISALLSHSGRGQVQQVNADAWRELRGFTLCRSEDRATRECLNTMELGRPGWNVQDARNIGMIASALLHPECTRVLNLDSDMVLPGDLALDSFGLSQFAGFRISGCPDLCRLEWLELYCRAAAARSGVSLSPANTYTGKLILQLRAEGILTLLRHYTDLLGQDMNSRTDPAILPLRHDHHGGCYLLSMERFPISPFPCWPDNDLFFFWMVRRLEEKLTILDGYVWHNAARKHVLDHSKLTREEYGKSLNTLYRGYGRLSWKSIMAQSLDRVDRILSILDETMQSWPFPPPAVSAEATRTMLLRLRSDITRSSVTNAHRELSRFEDFRKSWHVCVEQLLASRARTLPR